jgi:putative chitinase
MYDTTKFFKDYTSLIGRLSGDSQRAGISFLLEELGDDPNYSDTRLAAYLLATTWWETARTFQPITEFSPKGVSAKEYFNSKYSHRKDLGNRGGNDGFDFRGRGYCQITGRANYFKFSEITGIDLIANPSRALEPVIAYGIISYGLIHGTFTGKRLGQYIRGNICNYLYARMCVNRMDKAGIIAGKAKYFEQMLRHAHVADEKEN